jgi:hypothetical protein
MINNRQINTFNCWNTNKTINENQVDLYLDVIRNRFDTEHRPTLFLLQGITLKLKEALDAVYSNNILFFDIYGVHEEHRNMVDVEYIIDQKYRYCAIIWSSHFTLAYNMVPTYCKTNKMLGRRTSDWLVFNQVNCVSPVVICNIWLPPQKQSTLKDKPLAILQSILKEAEYLHTDLKCQVAVAGTFNIKPEVAKVYIPCAKFDIEHINSDVSTIQYKNQYMNPKHVDYSLFWGFDQLREDVHLVEESHHALVQYATNDRRRSKLD